MAWTAEFSPAAEKALASLDKPVQRRIRDFIDNRLLSAPDPRKLGAALSGDHKGAWKYRVGDWRIVARLKDEVVTIYVVRIGHRREVYGRG